MGTFWAELWSKKRLVRAVYISLALLNGLIFVTSATDTLHLRAFNSATQKFVTSYGPAIVYSSFENMESRCWVAYDARGAYTGCDGNDYDLSSEYSRIVYSPAKISLKDFPRFRERLCQRTETTTKLGCHDHHPTGFAWVSKQIKVVLMWPEDFWSKSWLIYVAWAIGVVILLYPTGGEKAKSNKGIGCLGALFFGLIIGTIAVLLIMWLLEALTFILGAAIGVVAWLNSLAVFGWLIWAIQAWRIPQDARGLIPRQLDNKP